MDQDATLPLVTEVGHGPEGAQEPRSFRPIALARSPVLAAAEHLYKFARFFICNNLRELSLFALGFGILDAIVTNLIIAIVGNCDT